MPVAQPGTAPPPRHDVGVTAAAPRPRPGALLTAVLAIGAVLAMAAALVVVPAGPSGAAAPLPASIDRLPAGTAQLITVEGGYASTYATLKAWGRSNGAWVLRRTMKARVGWNGLSSMGVGKRRQGDGTTPTGLYAMGYGFGPFPDPGTRMPWVRYDANDWWALDPRDPKTYNVRQTRRAPGAAWRTGWAESLWAMRSQYRPAFLIKFNLPRSTPYLRADGQRVAARPADTSLGGAIFLHVHGDKGFTAGCVSVSQSEMLWLARWMDPARHPHIAIGTTALIRSL
jgi:L,D-peptidoglycan transpeptidase YkuD (ErfK/YbiS/YcfS/YnhG family)